MTRDLPPSDFEATWLHGLRAVKLRSARVEAIILPDKGCDLHSFRCLETNTEMLAQEPRAAEIAHQFNERGATTYGDCYIGGWPSLLPSRARWDGGSLGPADCGEAATVCWETRDFTVLGQPRLSCAATLPRSGFRVVRVFGFNPAGTAIEIDITVTNASSRRVDFHWTEHPTFGGDVLEGEFELLLPDCDVVDVRINRDAVGASGASTLRELRLLNEGYFRTLRAPEHSTAAIYNAKRGVGAQLRWDRTLLPHAWYWQSHEGGRRALAIEPSNSYLTELDDVASGEMSLQLEPGDSLSTRLSIGLINAAEVEQLRQDLLPQRITSREPDVVGDRV